MVKDEHISTGGMGPLGDHITQRTDGGWRDKEENNVIYL